MDAADLRESPPRGPMVHGVNHSGRGLIRSETLEELDELGPDLVAKMTGAFEREAEGCLAELRKWRNHSGLDSIAIQEIQRAAHKLKGAAGSFGAIRLHQMCLDLEIWSGNDEAFQGFEEALEEEFRAVVSALHRHLQSS
jgi:HPt (histidine-containing phosphotransfer) domain-containing protein